MCVREPNRVSLTPPKPKRQLTSNLLDVYTGMRCSASKTNDLRVFNVRSKISTNQQHRFGHYARTRITKCPISSKMWCIKICNAHTHIKQQQCCSVFQTQVCYHRPYFHNGWINIKRKVKLGQKEFHNKSSTTDRWSLNL